MPRTKHSWTAAEARVLLDRLAASGQSTSEFCRAHGISGQRLGYWRTRLGTSAPPTVPAASPSPPRFVEVQARVAPAALELVLGDGLILRVPSVFDAAHLRAVVEAVRAC